MSKPTKTSSTQGRVFNICTCLIHPVANETIVTSDGIEETCRKYSTIKSWAFIIHDKDTYNEDDEKNNPEHKAGSLKPTHVHIVIKTTKQIDVETIAKWFGIASNFIELPKGRGKFAECIMYLTHESEKEQNLGKYRYPDSDVKTNLPSYREFVDNINFKKEFCKNADASDAEVILYRVLYEGMTIKEVIKLHPDIYQEKMEKIQKRRIEYLSRIKEMPKVRVNIYITGRGGLGKGLSSEALARAIIDPHGEMDDDEIFFQIGSNNTTFEGYDGQPVIIWDDYRSSSLHKKFEDRGEIFKIFDPFPKNTTQNIKYGSIRLTNTINIINSVQGYKEFLDNLSGEYTDKSGELHKSEDKGQSYRRFPLIIQLNENSYDLIVNKGVLNGTNKYEEFYVTKNIYGNFQKIAELCGDRKNLRNKYNAQTLTSVIEQYKAILNKLNGRTTYDEEELDALFSNNGQTFEPKKHQNPTTFNNDYYEEIIKNTDPKYLSSDLINIDCDDILPF